MDTHYTPLPVAKALIEAAKDVAPTLVADLAAGKGDLLIEAERVWPAADFVATDIDRNALAQLTRIRPNWRTGRCNLRSARSRSRSPVLNRIGRSVSLLLLNPPFSCRGGTRYLVDTPSGSLHASTAMSFLLLATKYLSEDGHVATILPQGSLSGAKDAPAWEYLRSKYSVRLLGTQAKGTFPGTAASTAIVRLSPRVSPEPIPLEHPSAVTSSFATIPIQIVRGCCPAHRATKRNQEIVLVHYTDLRHGTVEANGRRGFGTYRCVCGPAVLLPRVGRVTVEKVALLHEETTVMLSDCVIALKPSTLESARALQTRLIEHFDQLRTCYVGTGAPFITLARLKSALESLGVKIV